MCSNSNSNSSSRKTWTSPPGRTRTKSGHWEICSVGSRKRSWIMIPARRKTGRQVSCRLNTTEHRLSARERSMGSARSVLASRSRAPSIISSSAQIPPTAMEASRKVTASTRSTNMSFPWVPDRWIEGYGEIVARPRRRTYRVTRDRTDHPQYRGSEVMTVWAITAEVLIGSRDLLERSAI